MPPYHTIVSRREGKLSIVGQCWWHTIVPTSGKERTGYPTQKPLGVLERIVKVHSNPGDLLLDYFAGSGAFPEAAMKNDRYCIAVDKNPESIDVMKKKTRTI